MTVAYVIEGHRKKSLNKQLNNLGAQYPWLLQFLYIEATVLRSEFCFYYSVLLCACVSNLFGQKKPDRECLSTSPLTFHCVPNLGEDSMPVRLRQSSISLWFHLEQWSADSFSHDICVVKERERQNHRSRRASLTSSLLLRQVGYNFSLSKM